MKLNEKCQLKTVSKPAGAPFMKPNRIFRLVQGVGRLNRSIITAFYLTLVLAFVSSAQDVDMIPFTIDWRDNTESLVDLSFLHDRPAGANGFVTIQKGHLTQPDGARFRIWGTNFTGAACFPEKADAPIVGAHLARFGINCVRFHFLDSNWSSNIFVSGTDNTRTLDEQQLDRLDYFVSELKKCGIYTNINLNVGRNYRKADGVADHDQIGLAKVINYFDERMQFLHREYAKQLLTHYNPYTKSQYRTEPAVVIVELLNENSLVEAWFNDRLLGKHTGRGAGTWQDITQHYADKLTQMYNSYLQENFSPADLAEIRKSADAGPDGLVKRLTTKEFPRASAKRFHAEAAFYMQLEDAYFQNMYRFLKDEVAVKSLIVGTSDHNHYRSGYPLLSSTSKLDVVDGHVYWQHPNYITDPQTKKRSFRIKNSPMVDDPLWSTVVQLSRSAVRGKPYTVSETNHPFPSEYACEGIPILAAYAALQDWDGIFMYTFEHKAPAEWSARMPGHFDMRPDPVKMTNTAAGALMFLRGDIKPALQSLERSYSPEQVRESIRSSNRPFFTSGFNIAVPLVYATRISNFQVETPSLPPFETTNPFVSDTNQLKWYYPPQHKGMVMIDTQLVQALVGSVRQNRQQLTNLSAEAVNDFCSIVLLSLDNMPVSSSQRLLLTATARSATTNMKFNNDRTSLESWGRLPMLIEPVKGTVILRNIAPAKAMVVTPMTPSGTAFGNPVSLNVQSAICRIPLGTTPTTWYLIEIER